MNHELRTRTHSVTADRAAVELPPVRYQNAHVLVVEDEPLNREIVELFDQSRGFALRDHDIALQSERPQ